LYWLITFRKKICYINHLNLDQNCKFEQASIVFWEYVLAHCNNVYCSVFTVQWPLYDLCERESNGVSNDRFRQAAVSHEINISIDLSFPLSRGKKGKRQYKKILYNLPILFNLILRSVGLSKFNQNLRGKFYPTYLLIIYMVKHLWQLKIYPDLINMKLT
jgi:hypothetical protein